MHQLQMSGGMVLNVGSECHNVLLVTQLQQELTFYIISQDGVSPKSQRLTVEMRWQELHKRHAPDDA